MPFWTYMLHCRAGRFYVGHTDDLEKRINQHTYGTFGGFTEEFGPCEYVWSSEFATRDEALEAERRLKGWSRAKKLALIRGYWDEISRLAKKRNSASTSSARAESGLRNSASAVLLEPVGSEADAAHQRLHPLAAPQRLEGVTTTPGRLDKALAAASGLSRERVKALIGEGAVTVADAVADNGSARVAAGTAFSIALPAPMPLEAEAQAIPLAIVFEDEHLVVVDKPAGMVVHPAAGNPDGTLVNALLHHCAGRLSGINGVVRPGIVHRIDKDTSGLLVVAKTDAAHEGLAAQFADHSIDRCYLAVCGGHPAPPEGTIATRLGRSDADRKKMAVLPDDAARGKHAVTHYRTLRRLTHATLIECRLETGRTHQVRVHCASIGHALIGDPVYGRDPKALRPLLQRLDFRRQALHAAELGFTHPATGERCLFRADPPGDMRELIDELAH